VVQKGRPYTYFDERPIDLAEGAALHSGDMAAIVLERGHPADVPTIVWRAFSARSRMRDHRWVRSWTGLDGLRVRSIDGRRLPIQVDGDYIGEADEAVYAVVPQALTVVS